MCLWTNFSLNTSFGPSGESCATRTKSPIRTTRTLSTFRVPSGEGPGITSSSKATDSGGAIHKRAGKTSAIALNAYPNSVYSSGT